MSTKIKSGMFNVRFDSLNNPLWGDISLQRRGYLPKDGKFSYPFVLAQSGTVLVVPEWEWQSNVGVLLGAAYTVTRSVSGGATMFRFSFKHNGFDLILTMLDNYQTTVAPMIIWPGEDQSNAYKFMDAMQLLDLINQVLGQRDVE